MNLPELPDAGIRQLMAAREGIAMHRYLNFYHERKGISSVPWYTTVTVRPQDFRFHVLGGSFRGDGSPVLRTIPKIKTYVFSLFPYYFNIIFTSPIHQIHLLIVTDAYSTYLPPDFYNLQNIRESTTTSFTRYFPWPRYNLYIIIFSSIIKRKYTEPAIIKSLISIFKGI